MINTAAASISPNSNLSHDVLATKRMTTPDALQAASRQENRLLIASKGEEEERKAALESNQHTDFLR